MSDEKWPEQLLLSRMGTDGPKDQMMATAFPA
jgi:hypothetical protein